MDNFDMQEIERLATPRHSRCRFCSAELMHFDDGEPKCSPECIRAQKLTAAIEALTVRLDKLRK